MSIARPAAALLLALACACQTHPRPTQAPDVGSAGDAPPPVTPGDPLPTGEGFDAPHTTPEARATQLKKEDEERKARWAKRVEKYKKPVVKDAWKKAESAEADGNWKDALDLYGAVLAHFPRDATAVEAAEAVMRTSFALGEYGEGVTFAEDAVGQLPDDATRARLHRILGNTYLAMPHWGTTAGGKYLRNQWTQGISTQTHKEDRAKAIAHLEEARTLAFASTAIPLEERVDIVMDLTSAVAHYTPLDSTWNYWWYAWGSAADDGLEEDEGADEQADEYPGRRGGRGGYHSWYDQLNRSKPRGLPVTPDGKIVFVQKPKEYSAGLDDTAKVKYLLDEVVRVDTTAKKEMAARAVMFQALLFRTRDGTERLDRLSNWWWLGSHPYKKEIEGKPLHSLKDDEVLGLIATHIGVYKVPDDECTPKLLGRVMREYPSTPSADQAHLLLGTFHQSRQQYERAAQVYLEYLAQRKDGVHRSQAESNLQELSRPEMVIVEQGVQPAGVPAQVKVRFRNVDEVVIEAQKMDMERLLTDFKGVWKEGSRRPTDGDELSPDNLAYVFTYEDEGRQYKKYRTGQPITFSAKVQKDPGGRYADATLQSNVKEPGLYVLRARNKATGNVLTKGMVLLENMAVVFKNARNTSVVWVVDSQSGVAQAGAEVEVFSYWSEWTKDREIRHSRTQVLKTDDKGLVKPGNEGHQTFVTVRHNGKTSYAGHHYFYSNYSPTSETNRLVSVVMTDRPVYRPLHKVEGKVWVRSLQNGKYAPASSTRNITVRIYDPKNAKLYDETLPAGEWGSGAFSLELKKSAALGMYRVEVLADGSYTEAGGAAFRVEEYKAPEFTVSVSAAGQARLGDKVPAEIKATYLFGGGVAGAKVHYKVFRADHETKYATPNRWDWLYGVGYGLCFYPYRWLGWWSEYGPHPFIWYPWWGPAPEPAKELVMEGEGKLNADGVLKVTIDTAPAKEAFGKTDHNYSVVAEVTDQSRRLIKGEGNIVVTRNAYFAFIESARGYYDAGDGVQLLVTTQQPDGTAYPVKGKVVVEEVVYQGDNGDTVTEQKREEIPITTDALGPTSVTWRAPKTGQYKFSVVTPDKWGGEVRASTVVWVMGPGFNGRQYRFNGLEVITDRREYKVGDTARLLVNVNRAGSSVLLATKVENGVLLDWDVVTMPQKTRVITIPITAAHVPNFFVEATTVAEGTLFQEARELYVPPQDSVLNIALKTDKREYRPGDKGEITVTTTDKNGKPISADVAVSVFDSAVLYIQPELTPDLRAHYWGRKRSHSVVGESNIMRKFDSGYFQLNPPDRQAAYYLWSASQQNFQDMVNFRDGNGSVKGSRRGMAKEEAKSKKDAAPSKSAPMGQAAGAPAAELAAAPAAGRAMDSSVGEKQAMADDKAPADGKPQANGTGAAPVTVRKAFADTALWAPTVRTGDNGVAKVTVTFPDNLTTWRIKAAGLAAGTQAGQASDSVVSTKKLLIRLQAPRFFRERDHVTLSAIVHNKYPASKSVTVKLDVPPKFLVVSGKDSFKVDVPAHGEKRVDFEVDVRGEGEATVRMTALADVESDAKELTFPVLVHGMTKTVSNVGSISARQKGTVEKTITVDVPEARRPELSKLTVRYSPTLAGAILDALPYLLDYPYGCTEQTLSRFVPAAVTRKVLTQSGGLDLATLGAMHNNLNPQQLTAMGKQDRERLEREYRRFARHPVFDEGTLNDMVDAGMKRIARMQHGDGGWGWWADDRSSLYTTSYVLMGLKDAQEGGVDVDGSMMSRGVSAMRSLIAEQLRYYDEHEYVSDTDAFFAWVLSRYGEKDEKLNKYLWERRTRLSAYGKLLLTITFHALGDKQKAEQLMRNAEQFLKEDKENETAWLETDRNAWWYWWNNDIETNAMYLRALDALRPKDDRANQVVKWLLNHRKHGWYWDSTRDTAMTVVAFTNHMKVTGEGAPDYDLDVLWDGHLLKTVHINQKNLFTYDAEVVLEGPGLAGGKHDITFRRKGEGAVYFNTYLSYFTLEEDVKGTGLEIKVDRQYYKLERNDRQEKLYGDRGQAVESTQVAYRKVALQSGAQLKSGDLILVELMLTSKNDYTFLAFEDPKPAGAEAVALRSGTTFGEGVANLELRDDKVVFFLSDLHRGQLKLSYRLRAEIPGEFHAMPTYGFGMYAPELKTNSDEWRVRIQDVPELAH